MLSDKPWVGIVFSLLAGILMLVVWIGAPIWKKPVVLFPPLNQPIRWIELVEYGRVNLELVVNIRLFFVIGWALLILVGASALYVKPRQHSLVGVVILTISILTLLLWVGGLILRTSVGRLLWTAWRSWL